MMETPGGSTLVGDPTLLDVVERLRNRFFGKYRGIVSDVDAQTLRIKATVPSVLGDQKTGWARACSPYTGKSMGFAFLPQEGAGVWIEFEGGDVSLPIWTGGYWRDDEPPDDASDTVLAIVTSANQKILFDLDGDSITIEDDNGNSIKMDSDGITLTRGDQTVVVSDSSVNVNDGSLEVT